MLNGRLGIAIVDIHDKKQVRLLHSAKTTVPGTPLTEVSHSVLAEVSARTGAVSRSGRKVFADKISVVQRLGIHKQPKPMLIMWHETIVKSGGEIRLLSRSG